MLALFHTVLIMLHRDMRAAVDLRHRNGNLKQAAAQEPAK